MFLHLIGADAKFPPLIRRLFEAASPDEHVYVLLGNCERISHVWQGFYVVDKPADLNNLLEGLGRLDGVILNGILGEAYPYLDLFPTDVKLAWVIWGYELYDHLYAGDMGLYGPLTRRYMNRNCIKYMRNTFGPCYRKLRGLYRPNREVLQRLAYVVTQLPAEFELIRNSVPMSCCHMSFPVILLEDLVGINSCLPRVPGDNIQVGNSATVSNNHIEVFQMLQRFDLDGRQILVPLSYGDPQYRDFIIAEGKKMLGDAFEPITDFVPLKEYLALMGSCSVVIMNHYRQQALGNVIAALWRGGQVYLGPSSIYTTYRKWGLSVFRFDRSFALSSVSSDELIGNACNNRDILQKRLGEGSIICRVGAWLDTMKKARR